MKTYKLLFLPMLYLSAVVASAQEFTVPKDYTLDTPTDYENLEEDVIAAVDWLVENQLGEEVEKRKKVNAFVMKWLSGSPSVTISLDTEMVPYMESCSECLMIFMGGWAKHSLQNDYDKNKIDGALAGTELVIQFYESNKATLGKIKAIEKLKRKSEKGKLRVHFDR